MADEIRYVMILEIQKITTKTKQGDWNRNTRTNDIIEDSKSKHDVAKVIISDTNLNKLLNRGTKHLELVTDEDNGQKSS